MTKTVTIVAALWLLAGCAGPRPAVPPDAAFQPPSKWRGGQIDESGIAFDWWKGFGDPVLNQIVDQALARNDDIAIAAERVEEARAKLQYAQAQRLPDVAGGAQGGRVRDVNPGFGNPEEQNVGSALITATWDLDLFGRLRSASEAAKATLLASQDTKAAVRLAIAASTAQGYIALRSLDARLEIIHKTLDARAEALRLAQRRADAGYSTQLELHQAEAEYEAASQLVPATELALRKQEDALSLLLGGTPSDVVRGKHLDAISAPVAPPALPASLLRRRPDIVAAEEQLVASDRSLDSVRAAFMPDISLSAQGGGMMATLIEQNPTSVYTIAGNILGPIFDAGRLDAEQHGAAASRNAAAFNYRKTALSAFRDVEDALAATQHTAERQSRLVRERDALAASLAQATRRYRAGYSPYLEQIDAERALLSSELDLIQSREDRLNASVGLYEALGGGWSEDQTQMNQTEN
jgi:multidrug efflux system outer membrane protein